MDPGLHGGTRQLRAHGGAALIETEAAAPLIVARRLGTVPGMSEHELRFSSLDYVVVVVTDLERSLAFYTDVLGLGLDHRSGPFAQLATGTTRLALFERAAMSRTLGYKITPPDPDRPGFELGFKVTDVDAAFASLVARGAKPVTEPVTRPWGQRTAYIADPDQHLIELAQDLRAGGKAD
jgi:lactoylglutathione lyase